MGHTFIVGGVPGPPPLQSWVSERCASWWDGSWPRSYQGRPIGQLLAGAAATRPTAAAAAKGYVKAIVSSLDVGYGSR